MMSRWFTILLLLMLPGILLAQTGKHRKAPKSVASAPVAKPLEIFGIRPGISRDSLTHIMTDAGVRIRDVRDDTLSHTYGDPTMHVIVVDSIICRLTYMRMAFLFDASSRLRRMTITPRESAIMVGATDDIENVLLLYFGQKWGTPDLNLDPPLPNFRWRTGNIQMRGFIRRGYPMWVLEG